MAAYGNVLGLIFAGYTSQQRARHKAQLLNFIVSLLELM
jgi:hypothetical protein